MSYPAPTVLLVEDSTEDEFLILRAWRKAALAARIDIARDGQQALDYLLGPDDDRAVLPPRPMPCLVVLDLNLPRVGGFEVLRRIRSDARTALLPVVVLTSSDDRYDCQRCYELGANSFVSKPVDALAFRDTVANIAEYWTLRNLSPAP